MKWNKLTIETTTAAEDMLSYELSEMGMEGVEIEDHVPLSEEDRKIMYVDLLPDEIAPDDGKARISCYVDEKEDLQAVIAKVKVKIEELSAFLPVGSGEITLGVTEEEDWINNWKVFFKPFRLDDNIVIKPTWETLTDKKDDDIVVEIDPGTAFGSGSHETTKLCISQLKKYIKKDTELLDVGTGSGILSIIGLKLGAHHAMATDIDPNAIRATDENFAINGVAGQAEVQQVNILDQDEAYRFYEKNNGKRYDVVVANILADVIIPLSGIVTPLLKEDGIFITSGIINTMEEAVKEAMLANNFEILEINHMKDWVSITAKPKSCFLAAGAKSEFHFLDIQSPLSYSSNLLHLIFRAVSDRNPGKNGTASLFYLYFDCCFFITSICCHGCNLYGLFLSCFLCFYFTA